MYPVDPDDVLLDFALYGDPAPQGSKKVLPVYAGRGASRTMVGATLKEMSAKVEPWRDAVRAAALIANRGRPLNYAGPVVVDLVFTAARPARRPAWWPRGWQWSATAPVVPACSPDLDKMARSTTDGLGPKVTTIGSGKYKRRVTTPGALADDKTVVGYGRLVKVYPGWDPDALDKPGAVIRIHRWRPLLPCPPRSVHVQSVW